MRKDLHDLIDDKNLNSKTRLFEEVVFYLLRTHGKPIKEYHARFTSVADFSNTEVTAPRFRADLHETAYVGVTLKFFAAYAALVADSTSERRLVALGQRYGLTQRDSRRVVNMFRDLEVRKKTVSVLNADGIDHQTVDLNAYNDAIALGHELVVGLRDSITKHVRLKLSWVARSHSLRPGDLDTDITSQVISVYYSMLPTKRSRDHIHNYLCATMHSRIKNLQNYHSAAKRKRTVQITEHGEQRYALMEANESHINRYASPDSELSLEQLGGYDDSIEIHNFEFKRSMKRLMENVVRGTKRFALYSVLLGLDCDKFMEHLRKRRLLRSKTKTVREWLRGKSLDYLSEVFGGWLRCPASAVRCGMNEMAATLL